MQSRFFLASLAGVGLVSVSSLVYFLQEKLIYIPDFPSKEYRDPDQNPQLYRNPGERQIPYENIQVPTKDGLLLHGWHLKQNPDSPTIVFFQANAGNIGMRMDNLEEFYRELGANVVAVSYRGYGKSPGYPSEPGLMKDAEATMEYLKSANVDFTKLFVFGRSLGGAVGIYFTWKFPTVRGLILENTFMSISAMVDHIVPRASWALKPLLRNHWPSIERIAQVKTPICFISGRKDELVPPFHMDRLYEHSLKSKFKEMHFVNYGDHNFTYNTAGKHYIEWVKNFMKKALES
mmetsp:Transcript_6283/g.9326  ORF Transcript_6283/g.9326 Transcript_6283/m.9326 type:complete len:291 (+) Transcript_6283:32-904(+)